MQTKLHSPHQEGSFENQTQNKRESKKTSSQAFIPTPQNLPENLPAKEIPPRIPSFWIQINICRCYRSEMSSSMHLNIVKNCTPQISGGQNVWLPIRWCTKPKSEEPFYSHISFKEFWSKQKKASCFVKLIWHLNKLPFQDTMPAQCIKGHSAWVLATQVIWGKNDHHTNIDIICEVDG